MSIYITPISNLTYYVAMLDYQGKIGIGTDVSPEYTRADIVQIVRDHMRSNRPIIHVKHIDGNSIEDVTEEIVNEAMVGLLAAAE